MAYYLVYLTVRLFAFVITALPEKGAYACGRFLGRLGFVILSDRRNAAYENLSIAFGAEKSKAWIRRTARLNFEHLGLLGIEFLLIRRWTVQKMQERLIIVNEGDFNQLTAPGPRGILLLNSHFGCFEVSAATMKYLGVRTHLIATGLKNPFLSRYMFSRAGDESGISTYPHKGSVHTLINLLKNGQLVAVLADQRGDAERGVFVNFFGSPAPANEVFAKMALESGAAILPLCTYRTADGRYKSVFLKELRIQPTGDKKSDLVTVSQQFHDLFQAWLRIRPEQGFWVHRKWKRAPSRKRRRKSDSTPQPQM